MRQVVLFQGSDGRWVAEVPSLPGCISQGETRDEAVRNITEAAQLWVETMRDLGETIPPDSAPIEVISVSDPAA